MMRKSQKRLLFLCARRSIRELMAASLLAAQAHVEWDIWIAPIRVVEADVALARRVLAEIDVPFIALPQIAEPSFHLSWDEGIVLCSGAGDQ